jgi:DNA-binding FrmR family transcriptional regulator
VNGRPGDLVTAARRRIRRIQGMNGILNMIEEGRRYDEVIQQIAAAGKALDRVGVSLLVSQLQHCLEDEDAARVAGDEPDEVERLLMSLT